MQWFTEFVAVVFGAGLFINAALFMPQILKIWKAKNASDISLLTFLGFWILQLFSVLYGFTRHDWVMMIGFSLSLLTCGTVIVLIIFYRYVIKINT